MLEIRLQVANQLRQSGQLEQAMVMYRQVIAADPDNASAHIALGELSGQPLSYENIRDLLEKSAQTTPGTAQAYIRLGSFYRDNDEFDQACAAFRKAIELDSDNYQPYLEISIIRKFDQITDEVRNMQVMFEQSAANSSKRRKLGFALGKIFDDLQQYDTAFEYYREANETGVVRGDELYSNTDQYNNFKQIQEIFNSDFLNRYKNIGNPDDCPIFLIGMVRSGSTLTEQILSSHHNVHGSGENTLLNSIILDIGGKLNQRFPCGFDSVEPAMLKMGAEHYLDDLKSLANGELRITDKTNANYLYTALISVMLPKAKIIYCQRDPRDIGLSFYQHDLPNKQLYYWNLTRIGELTRLTQNLIEYWRSLLPEKIYVSHYENLVSKPEENIRALLDFCELEFDPACLEFFNTKREVKTVSRTQVRQPAYTSSIGRWNNYEKYLGPLIAALELK